MSRISIGHQLRDVRKKRDHKQADIAKAIHCDRAVISRIENGRYQGSLQQLERYINFLGFELSISPLTSTRPTLDNMEGIYDDE